MNVNKTIRGNRMELALEGKFDAISAPIFEAEIVSELEGIQEILIDLSSIVYISSAGLRTLLFLEQTMEDIDGTLVIQNVPEIVMNIFKVTGFNKIMTII